MQPRPDSTTTQTQMPSERLEQARRRVSFALSEITSDYTPDFVTLNEVARSLILALREMEVLQLTVAVMQRKERMMSR